MLWKTLNFPLLLRESIVVYMMSVVYCRINHSHSYFILSNYVCNHMTCMVQQQLHRCASYTLTSPSLRSNSILVFILHHIEHKRYAIPSDCVFHIAGRIVRARVCVYVGFFAAYSDCFQTRVASVLCADCSYLFKQLVIL